MCISVLHGHLLEGGFALCVRLPCILDRRAEARRVWFCSEGCVMGSASCIVCGRTAHTAGVGGPARAGGLRGPAEARSARRPRITSHQAPTLHCTHQPKPRKQNATAGVGDKVILRAALARLGLPAAAARIKRAIQFGSRIGKLSNCREFGSNRRANKASAGGVSLTKLPGTARKE